MEYDFLDFPYYDIPSPDMVGIESRLKGENQKGLLILLDQMDQKDETAMEKLKEILSAIKYNLDTDCHLLALSSNEVLVLHQMNLENYHQILCFGLQPAQLSLQIRPLGYRPVKMLKKDLLFADHVRKITQETTLKKKLWAALQAIFKP